MKKPLRIGLLGLGNMGQNHLRVLSSLNTAEIAWVYDVDREKAAKLAARYEVPVADSPEAALKQAEAVVICTPSSRHFDDLVLAAKDVPAIFVEKPLTADLESSRKALELIESKGLRVQVGFIERFNPVVRELRKVIQGGGAQAVNVDFTRTNRLSSRIKDVDVVMDLMIHDVDLALYLNGPVRSVSAVGKTERTDEGKDLICFASAQLVHENGSFSRIVASRITDKKIRRIEATCSDKYVDCELVRKELQIHHQTRIEHGEEGYSISGTTETVEVRQEEALLSELQSFVQFARNGDATTVPSARDGLAAMEVCRRVVEAI
ncbi:MAG: Gfo/Idh/MocA family oxidoreductase [Bdellovibrionales bacterium]|nr:Gfo/Idh/MocA family oxidoreductase [Bdellovibrionales bacterium]